MKKTGIKLLAFEGADKAVFDDGRALLFRHLPRTLVEISDTRYDALFFITGGSEREAVNAVSNLDHVLLLTHPGSNSHASATEVKAWLNANNKASELLDITHGDTIKKIQLQQTVSNHLSTLSGTRLGLIGDVSHWLVASSVSAQQLEEKTGISLVSIPWGMLTNFNNMEVSNDLKTHFSNDITYNLDETSKVYSLLKKTIKEQQLDALSVECFSMVTRHKVTACLPLAMLNDIGIPAACEGDLTSAVGMMIAQKITGSIPWMANTIQLTNTTATFAHCTVPITMTRRYQIMTHFETGLGTAIEGDLSEDCYTIFRVDEKLEQAFVSSARIIERPKRKDACRTQVVCEMSNSAIQLLRTHPLGNHHLFVPGNHTYGLTTALQQLGMQVLG